MMARTSDDTWDVFESVGVTALGTAKGRAKETTSECPLFADPYTQLFLDVAAAHGISYSQFTDDMIASTNTP